MGYTADSYEELLFKLKKEAIEGWPGKIGEERAEAVEKLLNDRLPTYCQIFHTTKLNMLLAFEKIRNVNVVNWYQNYKLPDLNNLDGIEIFNTRSDVISKYLKEGQKYRCPNCKGESTKYWECDSGIKLELLNSKKGKKDVCNWKAGGFFRTLGTGPRFICKETFLEDPRVYEIFPLV